MTHEHEQGCIHDLRFCYQCDVAYCGKCDLNWSRHQPTWSASSGTIYDSGGWSDWTIASNATVGGASTPVNHTEHGSVA